MIKENFYNIKKDDQETTIVIDYSLKKLIIYTSRYSVYLKLIKKVGQPIKKYYIDDRISSAEWIMSFRDKNLARVFSKCLMIGGVK